MLTSEFFHVWVAGARNSIGKRPLQIRTTLLQQAHAEVDTVLLILREAIPPRAELIGVLNFPGHSAIMAQKPYGFKSMSLLVLPARHLFPDALSRSIDLR
jgi:hypothetical protein